MSSILSVSQINTYISLKLKNDPKLRGVAVKGEISNLSINSRSGHIYFSLCDESSVIRAVMFSSSAAKLRFSPFDGLSVVAYGNAEVYERDGIYQLIVSQLVPDGEGGAYLAYLKLAEKLSKLGIFDAPKKPIPRYPEEIAVVTSPTGAAVHDVESVVSKRYPIAKIKLFPAAVQGAEAPESLASALKSADESGADVIILTRGGGSSEDLSAFNTELVTLAVSACKTPVISAVGHEIDRTLCDLAADLRAPTPSAAAMLATPDIFEMISEIRAIKRTLSGLASARAKAFEEKLLRYKYALSAFSVKSRLESRRKELSDIKESLKRLAERREELSKIELSGLKDMLESLNPKNVLSRGYALIYKDGGIVSSVDKLSSGMNIEIAMRGGSAEAEVKRIIGDENEV